MDPPLSPVDPPPEPPEGVDPVIYDEWLISHLKLLPKKGDLALPKNWRGICILDIASKIVSCVFVARMQIVQEKEGLEEQAGFRSKRGTIDGLFNISLALQKRREHLLASWLLFIDLVKGGPSIRFLASFCLLFCASSASPTISSTL
jgi:hypothetical protein